MSRIRRLSLAAAAALAALAAQEAAVRLVLPEFDPSRQVRFMAPSHERPVQVEPGTYRQVKNTGDYNIPVRINRLGFRDDRLVSEAGPDDWLVAGDSYSFGWGVDVGERLSERLESVLGGPRVFNIGMTGSFDDYEALLRHAAGLGAASRHLVVMVTMESDLIRYLPEGQLRPLPVPPSGFSLHGLKTWLTRHAELYFLLTSVVHTNPALTGLLVRLGLVVPNLDAVHKAAFDAEIIAGSAERLERLVRNWGKEAWVVIIPSRALWTGGPEGRAAADRTHRAFVAALVHRGLAVVDPRAAFEAQSAPLSHHFAHDGHWNAKGHALAAELLARAIRGEESRR